MGLISITLGFETGTKLLQQPGNPGPVRSVTKVVVLELV
jgi:hypothetical protein